MTTFVCRAILFDMDGTLVDSTAVVEDVWTRFATDHGIDPAEVIDYSHGRPTSDTVAHFLPDLGADDRERVTTDIHGKEMRSTEPVPEIPGAAALVTRVLDSGLPAALVTSADRTMALTRMRDADIPVPPVIVTADDVDHGKPAPDCYLLAAGRLGVDPADCLVVEDAPNGIAAARAAGAQVLVVGTTADRADVTDLRGVHVDVAVADVADAGRGGNHRDLRGTVST